jgi:Na+-driven multidrug efflux pump
MDNKKFIITLLLGIILIIILLYPIKKSPEHMPTSETVFEEKKDFSELQVTACIAAAHGGSCKTKLNRLGIVTEEECCKTIGECCGE